MANDLRSLSAGFRIVSRTSRGKLWQTWGDLNSRCLNKPPTQHLHSCHDCGLMLDKGVNAARNIRSVGTWRPDVNVDGRIMRSPSNSPIDRGDLSHSLPFSTFDQVAIISLKTTSSNSGTLRNISERHSIEVWAGSRKVSQVGGGEKSGEPLIGAAVRCREHPCCSRPFRQCSVRNIFA